MILYHQINSPPEICVTREVLPTRTNARNHTKIYIYIFSPDRLNIVA